MKKFLVMALFLGLSFSTVIAQKHGGKGHGMDGLGGLNGARLKKELNLSAEQITNVKAIVNEQKAKLANMKDAPKQERMAAMQQARAAAEEQISAILTPEQQAKFNQMKAEKVDKAIERLDKKKAEMEAKKSQILNGAPSMPTK